jgi:hypothetical protein
MNRRNSLNVDDSTLFAELCNIVPECENETDSGFSARVWSLIAAYRWGRNVGVQYHWVAGKDEDGDDVVHCCAFYESRFVGINTGWLPATRDDEIHCAWVEGEICWELFSDLPFGHGRRMYADLRGIDRLHDLGGVRPAELKKRIDEILAAVAPELERI